MTFPSSSGLPVCVSAVNDKLTLNEEELVAHSWRQSTTGFVLLGS